MIKTILIILVSVTLFGLIVFIVVKNIMKRRMEYYLKLNEKKNKLKKFK